MIIVKNQPVNFESDPFNNPYVDEIKYKQLVQQGDVTQFQFQTVSNYDARNLLTNPTFQLNLNGWYQSSNAKAFEWNDGVLYYGRQGQRRPSSTIQQDVLTIGAKYQVKVSINRSQNGYWEFFFGTNRVAQRKTGVHTISGVCEGTNQFKMRFVPIPYNDALVGIVPEQYMLSLGSIDYVFLNESSAENHIFPIIDTEDSTVVATLNAVDDYISDPYTPSDDANFYETALTMSLDWQAKTINNGCYRIGVCDANINTDLQCGTRNSELVGGKNIDGDPQMPQWGTIVVGDASILATGNGVLMGSSPTGTGTAYIQQATLRIGATYDYAVNISARVGSPTITLTFGTASVTLTGSGIKTGSLTCAGGGSLRVNVASGSVNDYAEISFVRIQMQSSDLRPDYYSNPFYLADTHHRTVVVNCNNTENVFGLTYENTLFNPRMRMRGYVAPDDNAYQTEREESETSFGRRDVYYYKRRKSQLLIIENEPEFVHDWLSLLAGHDHAMVDNLEYFVTDDEYPPISWDKYRVLGQTQLPIQEKQQLDRKVVQGSVKTAQFITDNDGQGVVGGFLEFTEVNETDDMSQRIFEITDPSDPTIGLRTPDSPTQDELTPRD